MELEEPVVQIDDGLKTISHEEFDKASKEYKVKAFEQIIDSMYINDKQPLSHMQMVQLYVSKLIETGKKEDKEKFTQTVLDKTKASFDLLSIADPAKLERQLNVFEFNMQLALTAVRDFNVDLKEQRANFMDFAIEVTKYIYNELLKTKSQIKIFTPTITQEALKNLDQSEKDLVARDFCLSGILFNALQLILHMIMIQSSQTTSTFRKLAAQQAQNKKKEEEGKLNRQESMKFAEQEQAVAAVKEWMKTVHPTAIFEIIMVLLGKGSQSDYSLNKANFDIVLLIATKLFSHPYWPADFPTGQLRKWALDCVELALNSPNAISGKLMQYLLSISVFDVDRSAELCGEMVKKFLFAAAIYRHNQQPDLKSYEIKGSLDTKLSSFKLAHFMDQTQDFYTVNPQNIVHDKAIKAAASKYTQVVQYKDTSDVQLKQSVLDTILSQERKQVPEFEHMILSAKQNDKQVAALIKQAFDSVITRDDSQMQKAVTAVFEQLLPSKLQVLNKILTFDSQSQQVCEFTSAEEADQFITEFNTNQEQVMELMDKGVRFCQAYRCLMPRNPQEFATSFLNQIHPLLWETERKRDQPNHIRFKVTASKVDKTQQFLFKFLNTLTGFNRIMTHEEKIVCYELRTKILQMAVSNFTAIATQLTGSKPDGKPETGKPEASAESKHQARLKAICMLMVINCLVDDGAQGETLFLSSGCFRSSFITLLCRGKSKFIRHIASIVKLTAQPVTKPSKEITYKVADAKMDNVDDQEMSFCSISDSLQEADKNDEKEEQHEDFQLENDQLHGILVAQSIDCLTAICTFIEFEKYHLNVQRKAKAKEEAKAKEIVLEEKKQPEQSQPAAQQNVQMISESSSSSQSAGDFDGQPNEEMSESHEEDQQLNQIGDEYIEDEYDAEEEEDEGDGDGDGDEDEEDEDEDDDDDQDDDMDDDDDDENDGDDPEDMWVRRQQRRRQAEAVQDIIDAPANDGQFDRFGMPIADVGPQHRGMRHDGRETRANNDNWSVEERAVQRTLAQLRGMRLNNESLPRRLNRAGFNPFGAMQDRYRREFEPAPVEGQRQAPKTSTLSDLTSIFAPITSKEILEFIQKAKVTLQSGKKKFVKTKDTNQYEQRVFMLLKERSDPSISSLSRSRNQLIEQLDARILDHELGFGRPFTFLQNPGVREDEESLLARYERMLVERSRLFNIQDSLPLPGVLGEGYSNRIEHEAEEIGTSRLLENYRALEVPARNQNLQILQQAVFREAEHIIAPQQEQPAQNQRRASLAGVVNIQPQSNSISSPSASPRMQPVINIGGPPQMLAGIEQWPQFSFERRNSQPRMINMPEPLPSEEVKQEPVQAMQAEVQPGQAEVQPIEAVQAIQVEVQPSSQSNQSNQSQEEAKQENVQMVSEEAKNEQPSDNVHMSSEEVKQEPITDANVQVEAQPVVAEQVAIEQEPMTCGIPNSVLLAHDIDPVILIDLPEDIQASVLSEINWQPPAQQQQQQPNQNQAAQIQEEAKEPVQQQNADPFGIDPGFLASLPPEMRQELMDNERLRNQNLGNPQPNPVQRQAEAMDVASIIQTAATPQLRAEMLANLDEATIATLPEGLRAEANAAQAAIRQRRAREHQEIERLFQQAQRRAQHHNDREPNRGGRGGRGGPNANPFQDAINVLEGRLEEMDRRLNENPFMDHRNEFAHGREIRENFKLEKALEAYCKQITYRVFEEEVCIEQQFLQMEQQIVSEDIIVEGILQLLIKKATTAASEAGAIDQQKSIADPTGEDAGSCKLIQFIQQMTTMRSAKGEMKLINKFINAITLMLKLELQQNDSFRKQLFDPSPVSSPLENKEVEVDQVMTEEILINTDRVQASISKASDDSKYSREQMTVILTLIGVIRLVSKNKHFVSHMLKSLLFREDYFFKKGTSMLQRQSDYVKASNIEVQPLLADLLQCLEGLKVTQKSIVTQLSGMEGEQPEIRKALTEKQAQLKTLSHNLQLAALDTFLEFNQPLVDVINSKDPAKAWKLSKDAVKALLQILELQIVDQDPLLLNQLSSSLIALFNKSSDSWQLIFDQCQQKALDALNEVNNDLMKIELDLLKEKKIVLDRRISNTPVKNGSILEERKDHFEAELMLSRQSSQFSDLVHGSKIEEEHTIHLKLDANQEAKLRSILVEQKEKITGLKHIFQLFNMIYKEIVKRTAKSAEKKAAEKQASEAKSDAVKAEGQADEAKPVEVKAEESKADEANQKILEQIREFYQSREMYEHMRLVNQALQTITASKIDLVDHMASNLSCIFGAYMPDLQQMIEDAKRNKRRLQINSQVEEKVTIKPLEFQQSKSKVLSLFKNVDAVSNRLREFASLCLKNKKAINQYLQLKSRTFTDFSIQDIVSYMPNILNFENKRAYFKKEIDRLKRSAAHDEINLNIRRSQIFMDAYANLNYRRGDIKGKFRIRFDGEQGIDAGGVSRDFFIELSRQMFNPDYSLFKLCSNGVSHYVAQTSFINPDHLQYLTFVGRMIGKALFDGHYMDCYFAKPLYKMILGEDLTFGDLEDLDNEFYKGLKWMLDNDVDNATLFFCVDKDFFDKHEEVDLIPNGRNIPVTNENKLKYIEHRIHFYLYGIVSQQIDAFLTGFYELIPKDLVQVFNHKELEMLISGLPNFDLNDLKKYTVLDGFTNDSPQIVWFWESLAAMDSSEIGLFLQFVTGCSKIPLEGFKNLQGMRGVQHFTIKRQRITEDDLMRLPQGHTCYNQLDLPEYPSKELLQERLLFAIKETNAIALT